MGDGYYKLIDESGLSPDQKEAARRELAGVIEEVRSGDLADFRMKIMGVHPLPFGGQDGGRKTQMLSKGFTIIRHPGGSLLRDCVECPVETIKGIKHPAVFPRAPVERFITLTTDELDVVVDCFIGSGSTAVACQKLNRRFIGIELNEGYAAEARKRVAAGAGVAWTADRCRPDLAEGNVRPSHTGRSAPGGWRSGHAGAGQMFGHPAWRWLGRRAG